LGNTLAGAWSSLDNDSIRCAIAARPIVLRPRRAGADTMTPSGGAARAKARAVKRDVLPADAQRLVTLAVGQNRILEMIATGRPLRETLAALLLFIEHEVPELLCSILLLDADGLHLRHGAAPSLPDAYTRAIDGAAIGPRAGSCGTAAYLARQVVVSDIDIDPLWADYRTLAGAHGLRACWSTPIFGPSDKVLATFAMYFREPRSPDSLHEQLITIATHVAAVAIGRDLRERALRDSEERYRLLNLATNDAVWDWNLATDTVWWNDRVERLFGYAAAEVTNELSWWVERVHPDDRARVQRSLHVAAGTSADSWREDYRFLRKDGTYADVQDRGRVMRDEAGKTVRMIGVMQDISERRQAQRQIEYLAFHEPVTRLPNRTAMRGTLADAITRAAADREELSLLLVNVNDFRDINDTLGHRNGDLLLEHVAKRLTGAAGGPGHVASLGGDEFAVLLTTASDCERALGAVHDCLHSPIELAGLPIKLDAAIGIAVYPRDGATTDVLWQHADVALRTAKERHESPLYYRAGIDHYDPARLALIGELRAGIADDELVLYYEPKLDLRSGRTVGVEALVRWQHPRRGLIGPGTFIPLAERTGLINPLTTWVVGTAMQQAMALCRAGIPLDISVNLSARNLHEPGFCAALLSSVGATGFPLSRLTLEVTETAIMADPARAKAALSAFHAAGIHLAMDDFGVGHSSLAYLKDLPITKMKIDKSFVMEFTQPRNAAIVRAAIDLARNLGLGVTAEGVEDEATYRALRTLGCDLAQGRLFSCPLAPNSLMAWLRESPWGVHGAA
jgi:diguanylate cyclase (GGDEF)-like protein/PAS domain S-box-containing protein